MIIILQLFQSNVIRDKFKNNKTIKKFSNKNILSRVYFLFFLFQNKNVFVFKQYNNINNFDFDTKVKSFFSKISNVVFIIKKTKFANILFINFSKSKIEISSLQRFRVVNKNFSFFWNIERKKSKRTYATQHRTIAKTKKKIKKKKKSN